MKIKIAEQIADRISELLEATPGLVAQLAAQYSQDAFREKAFDGHPWPQNRDPRRKGKELIRTGNLRNSLNVEVKPDLPYRPASPRSRSASSGIPSAALRRRWTSGLRIHEVSGVPGSTT